MTPTVPEVLHLYVSPGHNFFGRHGMPAGEHPMIEVDSVTCVAGRGLVGDRFFDYGPDYPGQVTFFAQEVFQALCDRLRVHDKGPGVLRRNIITRGIDLNALVGHDFTVGAVRCRGRRLCEPCMVLQRYASRPLLRPLVHRAGLRADILEDGLIRIGDPVEAGPA